MCLVAVLLELPLSVVQWAHLARLQPTRDAVEMEGVLKGKRKEWVLFGLANEFQGICLTLQTPQATVHSSLVADAWLAWHSMHRSMMWFRQIAQLSTTMSGRWIRKRVITIFSIWYNSGTHPKPKERRRSTAKRQGEHGDQSLSGIISGEIHNILQ